MSSILAGELKAYLKDIPHDYEVIMDIHHRHDIPKEEGERGWIAYINGMHIDNEHREVRLMN